MEVLKDFKEVEEVEFPRIVVSGKSDCFAAKLAMGKTIFIYFDCPETSTPGDKNISGRIVSNTLVNYRYRRASDLKSSIRLAIDGLLQNIWYL